MHRAASETANSHLTLRDEGDKKSPDMILTAWFHLLIAQSGSGCDPQSSASRQP